MSRHYTFCCGETTLLFPIDKSLLEVIVLLDSWSSSISGSCWDDTLASDGSLSVIMRVWWCRGYFFQALLKLCTSAIDISRQYSLVNTVYWNQRSEQLPRVLGVLTLIHIQSEALCIIFVISPEFIRDFIDYDLGSIAQRYIGNTRPRISVITCRLKARPGGIEDGALTRTQNLLKSQCLMMISPIFSDLSLSCARLYHYLCIRS